jgi:hypothetical protein
MWDRTRKYTQLSDGSIKEVLFEREESSKWDKEAAFERDRWLTSRGLDIGPVEVIC